MSVKPEKDYASAFARGMFYKAPLGARNDGLIDASVAGALVSGFLLIGGGYAAFNHAACNTPPQVAFVPDEDCRAEALAVSDAQGKLLKVILPAGCGMHRAAKF